VDRAALRKNRAETLALLAERYRAALRKNTAETLALLAERYPNLTIGQIILNAVSNADLYAVDDVELARGLNQLFIRARG
jgi:hypothetical protein